MGTFSIQGGVKLKGDVTPQGAKKRSITGYLCLFTY